MFNANPADSHTSYDEVPYPSTSHIFTHPDTMATAALLLGLTPVPVTQCRVLELGCAGGGNLIPLAVSLPHSEFVGIDASGVQIKEAQAAQAALGLNNITFQQLDILDVTPALGKFDYIIVHGIFSWVPTTVRDKILEICCQNLAPHGVAYVSYNTYPGWHTLGMIREMMLYHTRHATEPDMRIAQAREMLKFVTESVSAVSEQNQSKLVKAYAGFLQTEAEHIGASSDSYVYHEELEEVNDPLYFHEFAAWAERHQLQYLCEANFSDVFLNDFPPEVTTNLLKMTHNLIELEQYMDFLHNRTFRKTLLVHRDQVISRRLRPEVVQQFYVAANVKPLSATSDARSISVEEFSSPEGLKFTTDHPVTKAALLYLQSVWPRAIPFGELLDRAYERLGQEAVAPATRTLDEQILSAHLLKGFTYSGRLIELHTFTPQFTTQPSERPIASPWARYRAQTNSELTNLCHMRIELKGIAQYLLSHLDGTHDRADLLEGLEKSVASGALVLQPNGDTPTEPAKPVPEGEGIREVLKEEMEDALQKLARVALLIA